MISKLQDFELVGIICYLKMKTSVPRQYIISSKVKIITKIYNIQLLIP